MSYALCEDQFSNLQYLYAKAKGKLGLVRISAL